MDDKDLVRARVWERVNGKPLVRYVFYDRWFTRDWVTSTREHYPENVWDLLLQNLAIEVQVSNDEGATWEPVGSESPESAGDLEEEAPHLPAPAAPMPGVPTKPVPTPERRVHSVCEKCGQVMAPSLVKRGRKTHYRCPGKNRRADRGA